MAVDPDVLLLTDVLESRVAALEANAHLNVIAHGYMEGDDTDDTAGLIAAITDATTDGVRVYLPRPPIRYRLASQLTIAEDDVRLIGDGKWLSVLYCEQPGNTILWGGARGDIQGLGFEGSYTSGNGVDQALLEINGDDFTLEDYRLSDIDGIGIEVSDGANRVRLTNGIVDRAARQAILVKSRNGEPELADFVINGLRASRCGLNGSNVIGVGSSGTTTGQAVVGGLIADVVMRDCDGEGIYLAGNATQDGDGFPEAILVFGVRVVRPGAIGISATNGARNNYVIACMVDGGAGRIHYENGNHALDNWFIGNTSKDAAHNAYNSTSSAGGQSRIHAIGNLALNPANFGWRMSDQAPGGVWLANPVINPGVAALSDGDGTASFLQGVLP